MTKSKFNTPARRAFASFDDLDGFEEFLARRDERGAVLLRPGVILDMRDLDALRADFNREIDDLRQMIEILPVHRRVDR